MENNSERVKEGLKTTREINRAIKEMASRSSRITLSNISGQNHIGLGVSGKFELTLKGDPGDMLGAFNEDKIIIVKGSCAENAGLNMLSGGLIVFGKCGAGAGTSMSGGIVVIKDKSGGDLGEWMRGGAIIVDDDVDGDVGQNMVGGTIIVTGDIKGRAGFGHRSGDIFVGGSVKFTDAALIEKRPDNKDIKYLRRYFEHYAIDVEPNVMRKYTSKG